MRVHIQLTATCIRAKVAAEYVRLRLFNTFIENIELK